MALERAASRGQVAPIGDRDVRAALSALGEDESNDKPNHGSGACAGSHSADSHEETSPCCI